MNIFYLDENPKHAAQYHNDQHCVKMVTETAQILCSALRHNGINESWMYRMTHKNHPCVLWAVNWNNFNWLCNLGIALANEYTYRFGKVHKSQKIIESCYEEFSYLNINLDKHDKPALAMPDEYKTDDPVTSYRNYYLNEKQFYLVKNRKTGDLEKRKFKWNKSRTEPYWWVNI